jgi:hypothetical protein
MINRPSPVVSKADSFRKPDLTDGTRILRGPFGGPARSVTRPYPLASHTRASTVLLIRLDDVTQVVAPAARIRRCSVRSDSLLRVPAGETGSCPFAAGGSGVSSAPKSIVRHSELSSCGRTDNPSVQTQTTEQSATP